VGVTKSRACRKPAKSKYPVPPPPPTAVERKKSTHQWRVHPATAGHSQEVTPWRVVHQAAAAGHNQLITPGWTHQGAATEVTPAVKVVHQAIIGHGPSPGRTRQGTIWKGLGWAHQLATTGHGHETRHLQRWRVHQADHVALLQLHLHTYHIERTVC